MNSNIEINVSVQLFHLSVTRRGSIFFFAGMLAFGRLGTDVFSSFGSVLPSQTRCIARRKADELFDAGRFRWLRDRAVGRFLLPEADTEECYFCECHSDFYLTDDGEPYVSPVRGDSQWRVDLMENVSAIQSETQDIFVALPGERGVMNELRQRYRSVEIPLRAPGHAHPVAIDAVILKMSHRGARPSCGLDTLYNAFTHQDTATVGRWYNYWWA